MKIYKTSRGFRRTDFLDLYEEKCSLQESSLATDNAIWLGCNEGLHIDGECCARMHLNQEHVLELIPLLQYFVETGKLPGNKVKMPMFHPDYVVTWDKEEK